VRLPENFAQPYRQPNLTAFWNSWHITLAQWFRAYFFNPLTRALRTARRPLPEWVMLLLAQVSTMLLIGLWHGITWNFALWGLWHGVGLFIHNRWTAWRQPRPANPNRHPALGKLSHLASVLLNFHYVTLGWVWFALPSPDLAWAVFKTLFGF
jgi:D-alanyl-lipoteichoic acid acyltransferase DltB (MBOAT superfamily)